MILQNFTWNWSYLPWIIGILIVTYILYRALRRVIKGIINYKKLGKEEFKRRLNEGFMNITPTQKTKGEIKGIIISLTGMIAGIVVLSIFRIEHVWFWAIASLGGGIIITIWQLIGKVQQYKLLKKQDEIFKQLEREEQERSLIK